MSIEILMPALSPTMEIGKIAKWLKNVGDTVKPGDIIAEIETDKALMEIEAIDEGVLSQILISEGTEGVKVNTPIALLGEGVCLGHMSPVPPPDPIILSTPAMGGAFVMPSLTSSVPSSSPDPLLDAESVSLTVREALRNAMAEEMRKDPTVFLMGEEVGEYQGAYKVSQGLLDEFGPKRVIDTPITEHGFTGVAVGAAFGGLRPIVEFMTFNFSMQAIDQIINSAAKTLYMSGGQMGAPIVFRGPNGAAARVGAQHSQDFSSWYAHVPGLKVVAPYTAADAKGLLKAAIRDPDPVIFLENEILYGKNFLVPSSEEWVVPIGRASVSREGRDVTIVSFGIGMVYALGAAEALAELGISSEVIDLRTLRPLDMETVIKSVQKTNRCVTVEEGWPICSIGSEISAQLMRHAFDFLDAPVLSVMGKDVPMPYAANLEKLALPSIAEVVEAVRSVVYR